MISFLRKIRKNAIDKGNFKKVIWYALGEIFLIVIGILIAVNINNWNKERSDRDALKVSLSGLITDLEQDTARFSFLHDQLSRGLEQCDSMITLLELPKSDPKRIEIFKYDFIRLFSLNPFRAAYEEMKNSGKLYAMQETELSADIINYYAVLDRNGGYMEVGNNGIRLYMDQPQLTEFWLATRKEDGSEHLGWLSNKKSDTHRALEFLVLKARVRYGRDKRNVGQLKAQAENLIHRIRLETEEQ